MALHSIGIIGAGWLGGSVGRAIAAAGHDVLFASRHPERIKHLTEDLPSSRVGTLVAAAGQDIVLLSTPFDALEGVAAQYGDALTGKILIDATNPPGRSAAGREGERIGVAQLVRDMFPDTRLVRCFSAVDATCIEEGHGYGEAGPLGVPLASDDAEALATVCALVRDADCVPVPTGPLETARLFQRGAAAFRANTNAARLRDLMGLAQAA